MATQNFEPIHFPDLREQINAKSPVLGALFLFCIIFFTFTFLYCLYICTHRRHTDTGGGASNAPPRQGPGLDSATISSLPVSFYGSIGKKPSPGAECAICLSMFQEGDGVKVLPRCRHGFHSDCVDRWLRTRSSCPICRGCVCPVDSVSRELDSGVP